MPNGKIRKYLQCDQKISFALPFNRTISKLYMINLGITRALYEYVLFYILGKSRHVSKFDCAVFVRQQDRQNRKLGTPQEAHLSLFTE